MQHSVYRLERAVFTSVRMPQLPKTKLEYLDCLRFCSLRRLAELVGIDQGQLSNWIAGKKKISGTSYVNLSRSLDLSIEETKRLIETRRQDVCRINKANAAIDALTGKTRNDPPLSRRLRDMHERKTDYYTGE